MTLIHPDMLEDLMRNSGSKKDKRKAIIFILVLIVVTAGMAYLIGGF